MDLNYLEIFEPRSGKPSELFNRLKKNYKKVRKYYAKKFSNCFRIYDRDIPLYPVTVDYYDGKILVNYYWKRDTEESEMDKLSQEVEDTICELFREEPGIVYHKNRKVRGEKEQFEKFDETSSFFTVYENGMRFEVNLRDYLDTGIFLDHTPAREIAAEMAKGKRVLNLFSYTSSFSVYVLNSGADYCKSVDISNTYVDWSIRNHQLNNFDKDRYFIKRDDCLSHLKYLVRKKERFDLIVMDPPTLSRAKKMRKSFFHVQKDHKDMILDACTLLNDGGTLIFSNNYTTFKMDQEILDRFDVIDISDRTIPFGFKNRKIHKAFLISK